MLLNKDGKFKKKVAPSVIHTYKVDFHTESHVHYAII